MCAETTRRHHIELKKLVENNELKLTHMLITWFALGSGQRLSAVEGSCFFGSRVDIVMDIDLKLEGFGEAEKLIEESSHVPMGFLGSIGHQ